MQLVTLSNSEAFLFGLLILIKGIFFEVDIK